MKNYKRFEDLGVWKDGYVSEKGDILINRAAKLNITIYNYIQFLNQQ